MRKMRYCVMSGLAKIPFVAEQLRLRRALWCDFIEFTIIQNSVLTNRLINLRIMV
jgi:hypothetical protein